MVRRLRRPLLLIAATLVVATSAAAVARAAAWALPPDGACSRSERLRGWPIGEDAPPLLFETGDVIEAERRERVRDYLPPEIWEHRERFFFEGMRLEIGPCFRDYSPPAFFDEATAAFAGRAKLLPNGGVEGRVAGLPFPPEAIEPDDPDAGQKWSWNMQARYRAGGLRGRFRISDLVGRVGRAEPFTGEIFVNQLAHRADRSADGYRVPGTEPHVWLAGGRFFMPFNAREFAWLQYRGPASDSENSYGDELQVYIPNLRKVRRAPGFGIEGLFMPSFSVGVTIGSSGAVELGAAHSLDLSALPDVIETKRSGFEAMQTRPILYGYRVLGVQDVLAPINASRPAYPEDEDRSFGPWGLSWGSDRWELRRALVLEGKKRGELSDDEPETQRWWVDLQTLYPLYYVAYDRKQVLIDVGYFVGRWSEDRSDYPRWPDDAERPVRVIDSAGAAFANLKLRGSWRRESWDLVSIPPSDKAVRRSLSIRNLQKGH
jgi:hypothetical protein